MATNLTFYYAPVSDGLLLCDASYRQMDTTVQAFLDARARGEIVFLRTTHAHPLLHGRVDIYGYVRYQEANPRT